MKHVCIFFWGNLVGPEFWETTQVRSPPARFQRRGKAVKITRHISQAHGQNRHVDLQFAHRHSGQISYILAEHTISLDLIAPSWANRRQNEREMDHTMWQGSFTNIFKEGRITKGIGISRPILGADSSSRTKCIEGLDPVKKKISKVVHIFIEILLELYILYILASPMEYRTFCRLSDMANKFIGSQCWYGWKWLPSWKTAN